MSPSSVEFPLTSLILYLLLWFQLDSTFKQLEDITDSDGAVGQQLIKLEGETRI